MSQSNNTTTVTVATVLSMHQLPMTVKAEQVTGPPVVHLATETTIQSVKSTSQTSKPSSKTIKQESSSHSVKSSSSQSNKASSRHAKYMSLDRPGAETGYFKVVTPGFSRTSTEPRVQLGRMHQASEPASFISLGESRELSRHHVTIEPVMNPSTNQASSQFQLVIVGRNSVMVDGKLHKKRTADDIVVQLAVDKPTPVKTGDVKWWFCPPALSTS